MTRGSAVSRPRAVAGERRPRLRAAAAFLTEIRETSEKKSTTGQPGKNKTCDDNEVMMACHTARVKSTPCLPAKLNLGLNKTQTGGKRCLCLCRFYRLTIQKANLVRRKESVSVQLTRLLLGCLHHSWS